ncbi:MAG TPA: type II toxin-antitoxin system prevent-host-death family antitoxin [Flavisolibacter sp.]|jgi:antitoxin YefM|nr:type II toxin-antitoxin system prevent-host-death family antitoxin [Flavisolibacter sp.]
MRVVSFSEFRNHLAENLNSVNNDREIVVVSRTKGKNVVVMDLDDYNAIQETLHLTSTIANRTRLDEAIAEMNAGGGMEKKLIEE